MKYITINFIKMSIMFISMYFIDLGMFRPCKSGTDCWEENSECRSQKCGCLLGFKFLPAEEKCLNIGNIISGTFL